LCHLEDKLLILVFAHNGQLAVICSIWLHKAVFMACWSGCPPGPSASRCVYWVPQGSRPSLSAFRLNVHRSRHSVRAGLRCEVLQLMHDQHATLLVRVLSFHSSCDLGAEHRPTRSLIKGAQAMGLHLPSCLAAADWKIKDHDTQPSDTAFPPHELTGPQSVTFLLAPCPTNSLP